jgi:fructuronate reductase
MRLSARTLASLPAHIGRPKYDRASVTPGIVHLGIGAFHRAHQAVVFDDRLAAGETGWGIVGTSLRAGDTRDALVPQSGLYTLAIRSGERTDLQVIGSVSDVLVAPEDPSALLRRLSDPAIRIVSLTVTEKGYCRDPASDTLAEDHPDIRHDLDSDRPRSALGFLAAALARRRADRVAPFTILSCDNLPANGATLKRLLLRYATLRGDDLAGWIEDKVACPSTMVDRIVPATTDADRATVDAALGLQDAWPVMAEPFWQWVVEDTFPAGRPDLAASGVELVRDVAPYELMKLRLLNGSHSTLAYLGYLAGFKTISEAVADPGLARLVRRLMDESQVTLHPVPGFDLAAYKASLLARFSNSALKHATWQIAMDGSQKLPQRLLAPARERLARGLPLGAAAYGIAGWMRYVAGIDEAGNAIDVRDPLAANLKTAAAGKPPAEAADSLFGIAGIFDPALAADPRFRKPVTAALIDITQNGVCRAVLAL